MEKKRKLVWVFALASFLNDLGSDMIAPIWPFFVTIFLGANMAVLGFLDGLGEAFVSISQAFSGYLSDRIKKRKVFVWLGYFLAFLSRIGYAFTNHWQMLIPFRVMDRSGKIRDAPRDAMIADLSERKHRGRNFGILEAMDHLGAVFGIILSIILFGILGYKHLFLLAAIPSLIAVLLIFNLVEEKQDHRRINKGFTLKQVNRNFRLFLFLSALFAMGSFSYSFLLIYANDFGFKLIHIPLLYLIFMLFTSLSAYPFGQLADRIGRKKVLLTSYLLWASVCMMFLFFRTSKTSIILAFAVYGIHKGSLLTIQKTFVSELAPRKFRASSLGMFQMLIGLCALPASFLAGLLWYELNLFVPLIFSLILTLIASLLLLFVKEN